MALTAEKRAEQERLLREGGMAECAAFAREVPGADREALVDRVLASGGDDALVEFCQRVDGIDPSALAGKVGVRGKMLLCWVCGVDPESLVDAIAMEGTPEDCFDFASGLPLRLSPAAIGTLSRRIARDGSLERCFDIASYEGADMGALSRRVAEIGDPTVCRRFAQEFPDDADIGVLQRAVAESGNPYRMVEFAAEVRDADVASAQALVEGAGDARACMAFVRAVPGADPDGLRAAVARLGGDVADFDVAAASAPGVRDAGDERWSRRPRVADRWFAM